MGTPYLSHSLSLSLSFSLVSSCNILFEPKINSSCSLHFLSMVKQPFVRSCQTERCGVSQLEWHRLAIHPIDAYNKYSTGAQFQLVSFLSFLPSFFFSFYFISRFFEKIIFSWKIRLTLWVMIAFLETYLHFSNFSFFEFIFYQ